jgi:hypothetical protein
VLHCGAQETPPPDSKSAWLPVFISSTGTFELFTFSQFARDVFINLPSIEDLHCSFSLGGQNQQRAAAGHLAQVYPRRNSLNRY